MSKEQKTGSQKVLESEHPFGGDFCGDPEVDAMVANGVPLPEAVAAAGYVASNHPASWLMLKDDQHLRDPVVGPAIDMFADLPWSDYSLLTRQKDDDKK